jgi:polyhydroxyalkanoate synthesis regulator phasin
MAEVKNRLNEIMGKLVKEGEFVSEAANDRRAYYNLAQLQNEIEKLEGQLDAGVIGQEQFDTEFQVISDKLDQLIEAYFQVQM